MTLINRNIINNLVTYFVLLLIGLAGIFVAREYFDGYPNLRVWTLTNILLLLIGIPFLFFQRQMKFPDLWDVRVNNINRFVVPLSWGILFGIMDVIVFKLILHPEPYSELPPFTQPFPYSLLLYFSGAFEVEVFYRLIPLTLILLVFSFIKKGKYLDLAFWITAIITSIREPVEQMPQAGTLLVAYSLTTGFLMNLIQAIRFRKAGFLSSLSVRLGHYLIWHILLGIHIQYFEI